jgi:hypothetical protein
VILRVADLWFRGLRFYLRGADESVDRAVETTDQLFWLRMLWVQDSLEPEAIDKGDDLVDQPGPRTIAFRVFGDFWA